MNEGEAKLVNNIYNWYLELGSVSKLKGYLDENGVKTKVRVNSTGRQSGGGSFFRGPLYADPAKSDLPPGKLSIETNAIRVNRKPLLRRIYGTGCRLN